MATAMKTGNTNGFLSEDTSDSGPSTSTSSLLGFDKLFGALKAVAPSSNSNAERQLEFLFEDEYVANGPSWGARICYGSGLSYLVGLALGGSWGLFDGLRNPAGITSRLRMNCILNSCTARGPFVANNLAMLALVYNLVHGAVIKAREGKYDIYSSVGSATLAGLIYKSTKGAKAMGKAGVLFGSTMLAYQLAKNYYNQRLSEQF